MDGRVVDLSQPDVMWPDPIAIDSNVVVAYLQEYVPSRDPRRTGYAAAFVQRLNSLNQRAVLTPTAYSELLHVLVRSHYELIVNANRDVLSRQYGVRIRRWQDLYKRDPTPLRLLRSTLIELRQALVLNGIVIAGPEASEDQALTSTRRYDEELIERMVRYGLDSSDAMITIEASRLGIGAIVSMDRDMQRAIVDFDIYTWTDRTAATGSS